MYPTYTATFQWKLSACVDTAKHSNQTIYIEIMIQYPIYIATTRQDA